MRWAAVLILLLLCSSAQAADPWTPFRKAFPGPREPVIAAPLPPLPEPSAAAAIERALLDAELQEAVKRAQEAPERAEEAAKAVVPPTEPPRDPKSPKPKARTKAPLSLAAPPRQPATPDENDGSWLAPCFMVCGHVRGKTKAELDADEAYWRVTPRQKAHGQRCVVSTCPDSVPPDVLREMRQRLR